MTTKLAHQTQKTAGIPNGMRTATVVAVTSSSVTISVAGGQFTAGVGILTSYAPIVGDTVAVFRQDSSWLILGATGAVSGTAFRRVATANTPSDGTPTSGTTDSLFEIATGDVVAGATYRVKAYFPYNGTVASDHYLVRVRSGATISDTQIAFGTAVISPVNPTSTTLTITVETDWVATTTGQQSFCVTAQRNVGTGTLTPKGATNAPRLLTVELVKF